MKKLYCSKCGQQLALHLKVLKGKGFIAKLVDPHDCDGWISDEVPEGKETILQVIRNLNDVGKTIEDATPDKLNLPDISDNREDKKTSTAPANLLAGVKNMQTSDGEID